MIDLLQQNRGDLTEVCRRYGIQKLEAFGSAVEGPWDASRSDLAFVVEYPPDYDFGPWLGRYLDFKGELERLFERPVDLVMSTAPREPSFIREMNRTRTVLFNSS
jgi:predicted nucleotidyltransferase